MTQPHRQGHKPLPLMPFWICAVGFLLLAYGLLVFFGLGLPIYTDEIGWFPINHRDILDHYTITSVPVPCQATHTRALPIIWYVPAWINYLTYASFDNPISHRVMALLRLFAWGAIWLAIARRLFRLTKLEVVCLGACIMAFFAQDAVFLLLIMSRPEQTFLLGISIGTSLIVYAPVIAKTRIGAWTGVLILLVTVMAISHSHPKAIVLAPFFVVASFRYILLAFSPRRLPWIFSAAITSIFLYSYSIWVERYDCPGTKWPGVMARYSFPFHLLKEDVTGFLTTLARYFIWSADANFAQPLVVPWLIYRPESSETFVRLSFLSFYYVSYGLRLLLLGMVTFFTMVTFYRYRKKRMRTAGDSLQYECSILAACLLASLFACLGFEGSTQAFYYEALYVPMLVFACLLTFGFYQGWKKYSPVLFFALLICGIINLTATCLAYEHPAQHAITDPLPAARTKSFIVSDYEERLFALSDLAKECGIDPDRANHPVVDDLTTLFFKKSFQPYYYTMITFVPSFYSELSPQIKAADWFGILDRNQSDGIIMDCRNMVRPLLPFAHKKGGFCCIPKEAIQHAMQP